MSRCFVSKDLRNSSFAIGACSINPQSRQFLTTFRAFMRFILYLIHTSFIYKSWYRYEWLQFCYPFKDMKNIFILCVISETLSLGYLSSEEVRLSRYLYSNSIIYSFASAEGTRLVLSSISPIRLAQFDKTPCRY